MTIHNENPADFPVAWIREEALTDIRLDGVTLDNAVALGPTIMRDAVLSYAQAVTDQGAVNLLSSDPEAHHVMDLRDMCEALGVDSIPSYHPTYRHTQPRTIAVVNGPGYTLAMVLRFNRLDVIDLGNDPGR